jgi:hypothetical protein
MREALATARKLPQKLIGFGIHLPNTKVLVGMAPHLPESERRDVLREVLGTIRSNSDDLMVSHEMSEIRVLSQLANMGLAKEALGAAQAINDPSYRAEARLELLSYLPQPEQKAMLGELQKDALTIGDSNDRQEALAMLSVDAGSPQQALKIGLAVDRNETRAALALHLAQSGYHDEALVASKTLPDESFLRGPSQALSLAAIAPDLAEAQLRKALKLAWAIKNRLEKCRAVIALIPYLPSSEQHSVIARVQGESDKIEDVGNQVEILVALASSASEPLLRQTLAKIWSLKPGDSRALLLGRIAPHLPAQLLREALATVRSIDQANYRARLLATLVPHLPQDEREPILREVLATAWEREKNASRVNDTVAAVRELLKAAYPHEILATASLAKKDEAGRQAEVIRTLAAQVPEPLLGEVLATADSWANDHAWARALEGWVSWLAETGYSEEALALARNITYRETEARVRALTGLLPYLTEAERPAVLEEALNSMKDFSSLMRKYQKLSGGSSDRRETLTKLAQGMQRLDYPKCYALWRQTLRDLATQNRADLLSDLQAFAPVILTLGGEKALTEVMQAITDVGRWFP